MDSKNSEKDRNYEEFDENLLSDDETRHGIELTNIFVKDGNSPEIENR